MRDAQTTPCAPQTDLQAVLDRIAQEVPEAYGQGHVADYIPELKRVSPQQFGMAVRTVTGEEFVVGAADHQFSIQSISKLFTLILALEINGEELWTRINREPSGMRFNSLLLLESENGIPRNPFINAGAIVVTDTITEHSSGPAKRIEQFIANLSGNPLNRIDERVTASEKKTGYLNAAIANLLKAMGNLRCEPEDVLNCYFKHCAMTMSCRDLVRATQCLANREDAWFQRKPYPHQTARRINALLLTCGLYDAVGNFAFNVGLPAKSGVGGGIVAVAPNQYTVAVWSPELDDYGNSVLGQLALEKFVTYTASAVL
jgi:glutaminase